MTTKAEQQSGSTERPVEHRDGPPTPTIIVDPELMRAKPSNGAGPVTPGVPAADEAAMNARLSAAEAERFAATFRASWEPAAPVASVGATPGAASVPVARITTPLPHEHVHEHEADVDVSIVPGARERKRAMMITAGAVAGFLLLGALAFMSSRATPPSQARPQAKPEPAEPAKAGPATTAETSAPALTDRGVVPVAPTPAPPAPVEAVAPVAATAPETPANPTSMAALAGPPAVPAAPAVPATQEAPAATELVRIQVSASPSETDLSLDDAKIANPYDGRAPKGGKHMLRAQAEGYRSREITLRFDHDREITLELDKRKAPKASHPVAHAAPPPSAPARLVIRPRPPAAPVAASRAPAPPAAPHAKKGAGFVSESPY